jgi:hypothetical protein
VAFSPSPGVICPSTATATESRRTRPPSLTSVRVVREIS